MGGAAYPDTWAGTHSPPSPLWGEGRGERDRPKPESSSASPQAGIRAGVSRPPTGGGGKIGNAHLQWAFSEAACLLARESDQAKRFLARKEKKHGKAKALGILAARLGRAVYHMLRQRKAFDPKRFWNGEPKVSSTPAKKSAASARRRAKGAGCVLEA